MAAQVIPMVPAAEAACNDHQRDNFMASLDTRNLFAPNLSNERDAIAVYERARQNSHTNEKGYSGEAVTP